MIVVLASMLGQIGLPGGGFGFGWHYNGAGTPGRKGIILSGFSGSTTVPPVHDSTDYKGYSSTIPIARFIDAILEPGKIINWNGKTVKLPPLKMCVLPGPTLFIVTSRLIALLRDGVSWKPSSPSIISGRRPVDSPTSYCQRRLSLNVTILTNMATTPTAELSP